MGGGLNPPNLPSGYATDAAMKHSLVLSYGNFYVENGHSGIVLPFKG